MCAIWCAKSAQPFSVFEDPSLKSILHPTIVKNLPHRQLLSKAIHQLYTAVQENLKSDLKVNDPISLSFYQFFWLNFSQSINIQRHTGAMYLGVEAWQSPNRFDILGVVLYRLCDRDGRKPDFEAMPLDFVKLSRSHTGEYLAETVQLIVEKFEIQTR
jgi:hypothetical protein